MGVIQTITLVNQDGGAASRPISFSSTPAVGNDIFITVWGTGNVGVISATDNQGVGNNTYAVSSQAPGVGGGAYSAVIHCRVAVASGTFTVNVLCTFGDYTGISGIERDDVIVTPTDQVNVNGAGADGSTNPTAGPTGTLAQAAEMVISVTSVIGNGVSSMGITQPSGYTQIAINNDGSARNCGGAGFKDVSATTAQSVDWGNINNGAGGWVVTIASFKLDSATAYTLTADSGTYALTGQAVAFAPSNKVVAEYGTYLLLGSAAYIGNTFNAESGTYDLTGQDVTFLTGLGMAAGQGTYTLSGQVVNFHWSGDVTVAGFNGGTAVSEEGIVLTSYLDDVTPVPGNAVYLAGIAHATDGTRYVCPWPSSGLVYPVRGVALRADGAMVVLAGGVIAARQGGWALTSRGEVVVATGTPDLILAGWGLKSDGTLLVSDAS